MHLILPPFAASLEAVRADAKLDAAFRGLVSTPVPFNSVNLIAIGSHNVGKTDTIKSLGVHTPDQAHAFDREHVNTVNVTRSSRVGIDSAETLSPLEQALVYCHQHAMQQERDTTAPVAEDQHDPIRKLIKRQRTKV